MKHVAWLFILAVIIAACADDIVVPPQSELRGFYTGKFIIVENYGSGTGAITTEQFVNWTFTDQRFFLEVDTVLTDEIKVCDHSGYYTLANKMEFSQVILEPGTCNQDYVMEGEFSFIARRHDDAPDSLFFEHLNNSTALFRQLILVKDEE
jgi:hypothetical protein